MRLTDEQCAAIDVFQSFVESTLAKLEVVAKNARKGGKALWEKIKGAGK